jgi:hypothetical protein
LYHQVKKRNAIFYVLQCTDLHVSLIDVSYLQERIVQLFEKNTYSVVNIFDVTLRPQLNVTGVVEVF